MSARTCRSPHRRIYYLNHFHHCYCLCRCHLRSEFVLQMEQEHLHLGKISVEHGASQASIDAIYRVTTVDTAGDTAFPELAHTASVGRINAAVGGGDVRQGAMWLPVRMGWLPFEVHGGAKLRYQETPDLRNRADLVQASRVSSCARAAACAFVGSRVCAHLVMCAFVSFFVRL